MPQEKDKEKNMNVPIPWELHFRLIILCKFRQVYLKDFVAEVLRAELKKYDIETIIKKRNEFLH